ncbi:hypothetical protein CHUAL_010482 [Chamberlinius hualienensis]
MEESTKTSFDEYCQYLKAEQDLREEIRSAVQSLEQSGREILTVLQKIHRVVGEESISQICEEAEGYFTSVRVQYENLSNLIPKDQYYRYHDHWRFVNQRLSFLASLLVYLRSEQLITRQQAAAIMGVTSNREEGFHVDLEDFLTGLLFMATELARFAVNSVVSGDYARPYKIAKFVNDLNAGFRLLNLKNDSLRKRYDALKYDVKKIEEVVYDLSIRGIK